MTSLTLSNAVDPMWMAPETGLISRLHQALQQHGAERAQMLVLLPYAQLMPVAKKFWAQAYPTGLAPRFETTQNWAASLAAFLPDATDISFDIGRDLLRAQDLLVQAGFKSEVAVLSAPLVDAAHQLGRRVAAIAPSERAAWATLMRPVVANGLDIALLALESAVACIALEWALASDYKTDVLFAQFTEFSHLQNNRCWVIVHGIQQDPLMQALAQLAGSACIQISLPVQAAHGSIQLYATESGEDEAQSAAACVLQHLEQGRIPVALAVSERSLTRRISSILATQQVVLSDENGWKLSTTRSAAQLMAALRACGVHADTDAVLNWLKNSPAFNPDEVSLLEKEMRKMGLKKWSKWLEFIQNKAVQTLNLQKFTQQLELEMQKMAGLKTLQQWQIALQQLLVFCGQWTLLTQDAAGQKIAQALRLDKLTQAEFANQMAACTAYLQPVGLAEFMRWVNSVLEAGVFKFNDGHQAHVVVLPLSQLLARPFPAVVLAGCDAERFNVAPEPSGLWTLSQRKNLALATRDDLQNAMYVAWQQALQIPYCDILWRTSNDGGDIVLPCAWVQMLQLERTATANPVQQAPDPRVYQLLHEQPMSPPQPQGNALSVSRLSASAYEDLRACPYRFFALRQLGLRDSPELDADLDKRDFGLWLHAVLKNFHTALSQKLQRHNVVTKEQRLEVMQHAVAATQLEMGLSEAEFLPFAAAWPKIREGYLTWLESDESKGAKLASVEHWLELPLGQLTLVGQIDRIDMLTPAATDGAAAPASPSIANPPDDNVPILRVIDYKTESPEKTKARIKNLTEDTQLAFYAALVATDSPRAAYVNVDEKSGTQLCEMSAIVEVREALVHGIIHDMQQIAAGAKLPALGTGLACDYCAARGLCRKDFWPETEGNVCAA